MANVTKSKSEEIIDAALNIKDASLSLENKREAKVRLRSENIIDKNGKINIAIGVPNWSVLRGRE